MGYGDVTALFGFPKPYSIARVIAEVWYTR